MMKSESLSKENKTKKYLQQVFRLDREINALLFQREKLWQDRERCTSRLSVDPPSGSRSGTSPQEAALSQISELDQVINQKFETLMTRKREIFEKIYRMDPTIRRTVIIYRYLNFLKWEEIMAALGYERTQVYRLHGEALVEFEKKGLNGTN